MTEKRPMILWALAFSLLGASSHAGEDSALREMLVIGKMPGACGILDPMIHFQDTTEMPGGEEFVARFWGYGSHSSWRDDAGIFGSV